MPITPSPARPVRSPAAVNEDIRALWEWSGNVLSPQGRRAYERLLVEWAAAVREDVVEAA
ncbi:hypothetical protein ACFYWN_37625 [Streptomyces sp. NPDC002917]|uniref:hypothetical protein n=1 Tax=Streptomyces sp. NPDC002917 TaxID=3364671 RepID=UPI003683EBBC